MEFGKNNWYSWNHGILKPTWIDQYQLGEGEHKLWCQKHDVLEKCNSLKSSSNSHQFDELQFCAPNQNWFPIVLCHCFLISQGFSSMIQPLNMVLFLRGQWWFPTRPFQSSPGHMQMRPFATMLHLLEYHPVGIGGWNFEPEIETRLLMEEILHQFICGLSRYPISYDGFYTSPGGCLGFLPSTVWIEICVGWNSK